MAATLDRLAAFGLDATLSAAAWLGFWLPALVVTRQPARRRIVALIAGLGSLAIPVLIGLEAIPRMPIGGFLRELAPPGFGPSWARAADFQPALLARALVVAYAIGLGLQACRWLLAGWGIARLIRGSTAPSHGTASLYTWLTRDLGRVPRLRVSARVRAPALLGAFRPCILIPTPLDRAPHREALRLALLHELAHFQRRDPLVGLAAGLSQAAWFFLPPAWWFASQLRLDQEFLADRDAAGSFGSRERYAAVLFERAGPLPDRERSGRMLGSAWIGGSALYQRLRMLLRCPFAVEAIAPTWYRAVAWILGTTLAFSLAGLSWGDGFATGRAPAPPDRQFSLRRLRIGPQPRPRPETLPIPLGADFELTADFLGDSPADLRGARLAGYQLPDFVSESLEGRFSVHLIRRGGEARWRLGDREVPAGRPDEPPSAWLTVTAPPDRPVEVRDLTLKHPEPAEKPAGRQSPAIPPFSRSTTP
ncbi:MAG: M56 family metallopeptidase [Isosphaeraceae bacterium]